MSFRAIYNPEFVNTTQLNESELPSLSENCFIWSSLHMVNLITLILHSDENFRSTLWGKGGCLHVPDRARYRTLVLMVRFSVISRLLLWSEQNKSLPVLLCTYIYA